MYVNFFQDYASPSIFCQSFPLSFHVLSTHVSIFLLCIFVLFPNPSIHNGSRRPGVPRVCRAWFPCGLLKWMNTHIEFHYLSILASTVVAGYNCKMCSFYSCQLLQLGAINVSGYPKGSGLWEFRNPRRGPWFLKGWIPSLYGERHDPNAILKSTPTYNYRRPEEFDWPIIHNHENNDFAICAPGSFTANAYMKGDVSYTKTAMAGLLSFVKIILPHKFHLNFIIYKIKLRLQLSQCICHIL